VIDCFLAYTDFQNGRIRTKMDPINKFTSLFVKSSDNTMRDANKIITANNNESLTKEQARLWLNKFRSGLSKEEKIYFRQWAKQSAAHRNEIFSLAALCDDLHVHNELSALFPLEKSLLQKKQLIAEYTIAACITFILLLSGNLFLKNSTLPTTNNERQFVEVRTLHTDIGQQTRFSLSDGSKIKLNTNSLVRVSFSKNNRLLTLIKGEANFDVAKDKGRPFIVKVGGKSFTALGTVFNIQKTTDKDMELVVTEGRVLITTSNDPLNEVAESLTTLHESDLSNELITSGEIATIKNNIHSPKQKISFEQRQRELAWQQGRLVFHGEPLDKVLAEVSRYTTTKFEITDAELSKIKVAGYFKANDIDGLLKSLSSNFKIKFEITKENDIRLSRNANK